MLSGLEFVRIDSLEALALVILSQSRLQSDSHSNDYLDFRLLFGSGDHTFGLVREFYDLHIWGVIDPPAADRLFVLHYVHADCFSEHRYLQVVTG